MLRQKFEAGQSLAGGAEETMDEDYKKSMTERIRRDVPEVLAFLEKHPEIKKELGGVVENLEDLEKKSENGTVDEKTLKENESFLDNIKVVKEIAEREDAMKNSKAEEAEKTEDVAEKTEENKAEEVAEEKPEAAVEVSVPNNANYEAAEARKNAARAEWDRLENLAKSGAKVSDEDFKKAEEEIHQAEKEMAEAEKKTNYDIAMSTAKAKNRAAIDEYNRIEKLANAGKASEEDVMKAEAAIRETEKEIAEAEAIMTSSTNTEAAAAGEVLDIPKESATEEAGGEASGEKADEAKEASEDTNTSEEVVDAKDAEADGEAVIEADTDADAAALAPVKGKKIVRKKIVKLKIDTAGKTKEEIEQAKAEALQKYLEKNHDLKMPAAPEAEDGVEEEDEDVLDEDAAFAKHVEESWADKEFRGTLGVKDLDALELKKAKGEISEEEYNAAYEKEKERFKNLLRKAWDRNKAINEEQAAKAAMDDAEAKLREAMSDEEKEAQAELAKGVKKAMESDKKSSFFDGYESAGENAENGQEVDKRRSLVEKLRGFFKHSERVRKGSEQATYNGLRGWKKAAFASMLSVVAAVSIGGFIAGTGAFAKDNIQEYKIPDIHKSAIEMSEDEEVIDEAAAGGNVVDAEVGEVADLSRYNEKAVPDSERLPDTVKGVSYGEAVEFNTSAGDWSGESDYFSEAKIRNGHGQHNLTAPIYDIDHRGDYSQAELAKQGVEGLAQRLDDPILQAQFASITGSEVKIDGVNGINSFEDMNFVALMAQSDDVYRENMAEYSKGVLQELVSKYDVQVETVKKGEVHGSLYAMNIADSDEAAKLKYFVDDEVSSREDYEVLKFMDSDQNVLDKNEIGGYKHDFLKAIGKIPEGASDEQAMKIMSSYKILGISQLCSQIIWEHGGKTYVKKTETQETKPEEKIEETKNEEHKDSGDESAGNESAGNESAGDESAGNEITGSAGDEGTGTEIVGSAGNESAGDESAGNESAGNESAGDESAGDESAGDESAGDESAGNESAGDESAGNESAGNESAGDESAGNESAGDESAGNESAGDESAGNESAGDESAGFEGVVPKTEERTVKDTNPYVDPLPTTPEDANRGKEVVTEDETGKIDEDVAGGSSEVADDNFLNGGNKTDNGNDQPPAPTDTVYDGSDTSGWQGDEQSKEEGTQDIQEPETPEEVHEANNSEADQNTVPDTSVEQGDQESSQLTNEDKANMMNDMF